MASTEAHRTERTDDVNLKRRRAQAEPIPASAVSNDGSPSALLVAEGVRKIYRTGEGEVVAPVGVNPAAPCAHLGRDRGSTGGSGTGAGRTTRPRPGSVDGGHHELTAYYCYVR
jgi:hypothetical protein